MKPVAAVVLASVAALGLLSACSDNKSSSLFPAPGSTVSGSTVAASTVTGSSLPSADSTAPGVSIPTGLTIPQATIDLMISQFEANGVKVDKACFTALLQDESLRKLISASGATPSPEVIQKFISCMAP